MSTLTLQKPEQKTRVITQDRQVNSMMTPVEVLERILADIKAGQYQISDLIVIASQNGKLHMYTSSPSFYGPRGLMEAARAELKF